MIYSLLNIWKHLKINLIHNESIKTFFDVAWDVELKDEWLSATNITTNVVVDKSGSTISSGFKPKKNWKKKENSKENEEELSKKIHKLNSNKGKWFPRQSKKEVWCPPRHTPKILRSILAVITYLPNKKSR